MLQSSSERLYLAARIISRRQTWPLSSFLRFFEEETEEKSREKSKVERQVEIKRIALADA